jgi:hypothetical protein
MRAPSLCKFTGLRQFEGHTLEGMRVRPLLTGVAADGTGCSGFIA